MQMTTLRFYLSFAFTTVNLFMHSAAKKQVLLKNGAVNIMQMHVPSNLSWKWNKILSILTAIKSWCLNCLTFNIQCSDRQKTRKKLILSTMKRRRPQNAFLMDETFIGNQCLFEKSEAFRCEVCNPEVESINRISISTSEVFVVWQCWCLCFWILSKSSSKLKRCWETFLCFFSNTRKKFFGLKRGFFWLYSNPTDLQKVRLDIYKHLCNSNKGNESKRHKIGKQSP